jgi:subtilase family serine protease
VRPLIHRSSRGAGRVLGALVVAVMAGCAAPGGPPDPGAQLGAVSIDEAKLVVLAGNTHPRADAAHDVGPVDDGLVFEHMQLVLKRSSEQEARLVEHIEKLHDRGSPLYHQWLTAAQFAATYGVARSDVTVVTRWLSSHGFHVDSVADSRMFVEFTGTARQVRETFHTEIHNLRVKGEAHLANMSDPQIPAALAPVVVGVHALHDFMPHPLHESKGLARRDSASGAWSQVDPDLTVVNGSSYAVAPADFATIYNLDPLFTASTPIRGCGQTIAVIEDTNIKNPGDVAAFRSAFGVTSSSGCNGAGAFTQVHPTGKTTCVNPGVNGDEPEAALDAEWAGAAAPDAAIELASCSDTLFVFGGLIAVQNLINSATPPPIISISYAECEAENGASGNASYVSAYQQAAAEGISVFVAAGDWGAAVCDAGESAATRGIAVNGFASTPYNVAVGGTDFADTYEHNRGGPALSPTYWSATNGSALSYIPEIPWNDSCAGSLLYTNDGFTSAYGPSSGTAGFCNTKTNTHQTVVAGSGGPSAYSRQPSWQTGVVGLPTASGGRRSLPDVSLFAANGLWGHYYVFCFTDKAQGGIASCAGNEYLAAGGTSFASPAMAGIQALVNQKAGASQGNPNTVYYKLAAAEFGATGNAACNSNGPVLPASTCVFNDVTLGDIDVNCTGSDDCYGSSRSGHTTYDGVLSTSATTLTPAFAAGTGWDYATGLGTVNATNLVDNW